MAPLLWVRPIRAALCCIASIQHAHGSGLSCTHTTMACAQTLMQSDSSSIHVWLCIPPSPWHVPALRLPVRPRSHLMPPRSSCAL